MKLPPLDEEFGDPPLEVVEWADSQTTFTSWTYVHEIADDRPALGLMLTAGWVLRENDDAILICASLGGIDGKTTPQIAEAVTIPKCAIRRRHVITGGKGG